MVKCSTSNLVRAGLFFSRVHASMFFFKRMELFKKKTTEKTLNRIPVMADLKLSKKLILEPLVKVHIVKQFVGC